MAKGSMLEGRLALGGASTNGEWRNVGLTERTRTFNLK